MMGFRTKRSEYFMNPYSKLIWGGKLGSTPRSYISAVAIIGYPGQVKLYDGTTLITGRVIGYL